MRDLPLPRDDRDVHGSAGMLERPARHGARPLLLEGPPRRSNQDSRLYRSRPVPRLPLRKAAAVR